jgi:hypothetical protein
MALILLVASMPFLLISCASTPIAAPAEMPRLGSLQWQDDFDNGLDNWVIEIERPGVVTTSKGALEVDVPAGATLWFKRELFAPVTITFEATAIAADGPNDRVSDINTFWMAHNRDGSAPFTRQRHGAFEEYNNLLTYYVGLGGNWNTTTRFRRYIGDPESRPLLPEHDLSSPDALLIANQKQTIMLIADGRRIEYWREGIRLLQYDDPAPYKRGWFAIRTTRSHLRIERLRIYGKKRLAVGPLARVHAFRAIRTSMCSTVSG